MSRYFASGQTPAALANGNAIASIVPTASIGFKLIRAIFGVVNAGGTPTDFQVGVGINRATARGTSSGTATVQKGDPQSGASVITGVDNAWSVQPTLAAADLGNLAFNTRGGADTPFTIADVRSDVGTANPIVFVNRSGAALPASHQITWTLEWEE